MNTEVREALTAAQVGPLVQKRISPLLLETVRRYSPLLRSIPTDPWNSTVYYFNSRTALPGGGFVTDGGTRPVTNSTYTQGSFPIKILLTVGAVTGFAEQVTSMQVGSLRQKEINGARQGLIWDLENAICWGNSSATAAGQYPQFDGLDSQVNSFSGTTQNSINRAGATFALADLDKVTDLVEENAASPVMPTDWMYVLSPAAVSKIGQLLQGQQRFETVEITPGLVVASYRGIPLVKSTFLAARQNAMGAITLGTSGTGGTLAAATYYYRVSAVIARYGEIAACTEVSQATSGATSTVTITLSTPTGPDSMGPQLYKVFRGGTGAEVLIGVVDAFDTTGTAVTTIVDTGTNLLLNGLAVGSGTGPSAYVQPATGGQPPLEKTEENIYLIPRNPDFLVRPYIRDLEMLPLSATTAGPDQMPFAVISDSTLAIRGPKYVGRLTRVVVSL